MHHYGLFVLVVLVIVIVVGAYSVVSQSFVGIQLPSFIPTSPFRVSVSSLLGTSTRSEGTVVGVGTRTNSSRTPVSRTNTNTTTTPQKPTIIPPTGFTTDQLSPYYGTVYISSVTPTRSSREAGRFSLGVRKVATHGLNVTGWYMKGNRGGNVVIEKAVEDYEPFGLAPESEIILKNGDVLNGYIGVTPIGRNMRLNLCTGYLNTFFKVIPSFPNNCPRVDRKDIITFPGNCQSFILSLGSCRIPTSNELNQFTGQNDAACHALLNTLQYRGCYDRYHRYVGFLDNEVRIWIQQGPLPFDTLHDRVLLFDKEGKLVDEYVY